MATKKITTPQLTLPGLASVPQGGTFAVYQRGAETYENTRLGQQIELVGDDGQVRTGTVQEVRIGSLIDLIQQTLHQNIYTYGRPANATTLVQTLTEASPDEVLDVTKLYTSLLVAVAMASPPMMPAPAA